MQGSRGALRLLRSPAKIASVLDWKKTGSILVVDIGHDRIGLALASHPILDRPVEKLDPIEMKLKRRTGASNNRVLTQQVLHPLHDIVDAHNVCGLVVSWPLQKEGRMGAPCGKVLHTLESLASESPTILQTNRPFCLWDDHHYAVLDDQFGRNSLYGVPSSKKLHVASQEQYAHVCNSTVAANVWTDFCKRHWPELCESAEEDDFPLRWSSSC